MVEIVNIELLAGHKEAIPVLAEWYHSEWAFLYPGRTVQDFRRMIGRRAHMDRLPLALIAYQRQELIGTVSLKSSDMGSPKSLSPWLTSLYVKESCRNRGIGSRLVSAVEDKAYTLGMQKLYLFTVGLEPYYAKLGWNILEQTRYSSYTVSIMVKILSQGLK
jgi:GNAT superfamily N-acetyltransferase